MDAIEMKLYTPKGDGKDVTVTEVPAEHKELMELEKTALAEHAAEATDELIEKFLGGEELTTDEIRTGLKEQLKNAKLTPVFAVHLRKL
jgi:elongation factor G